MHPVLTLFKTRHHYHPTGPHDEDEMGQEHAGMREYIPIPGYTPDNMDHAITSCLQDTL